MKEFDYAVEALNAGADYFMRKAIDPDDLNSVIGRDKGLGAADWICRNTTYSVYKNEADTPVNINSLNSNFSFDNYKIYLSMSVEGNFYAVMECNIKIAEAAEHNRMF